MPIKDKEKRKEYMREYQRERRKTIKDKYDPQKKKEYYEKNKEQIKVNMKEYTQTEKGKKVGRVSHWKQRGVIGDYDELYEIYLNTNECNACKCTFTDTNKKCLDHDHETGEFRQILCDNCNIQDRWKIKDQTSF
jgi:hypothetical protein